MIISPFIGSFLGVLVHRLPSGSPILWSRSKCDHCGRVLAPWNLVPVISFLFQRGKSQCCDQPIDPRWLWIELLAFAIVVICMVLIPWPHAVLGMVLGWGLLALSFIDADVFRLPDVITFPLLVLGLGATAWFDPASLNQHILAAVLGWGLLMTIKIGYSWLRGREGLGEGDAKLMAVGGAWLGPYAISPILLVSCGAVLLWFLFRRIQGARVSLTTKLPYGVFLSLAIFSLWLINPWII